MEFPLSDRMLDKCARCMKDVVEDLFAIIGREITSENKAPWSETDGTTEGRARERKTGRGRREDVRAYLSAVTRRIISKY